MSTTVSYKGSTIATVSNQTKTLTTSGKYMEADVVITDTPATKDWVILVSNNLHDSSTDVANYYINHSGVLESYSGWSATDYISVSPNTWYRILSGPGNNWNAFYDSSKNPITNYMAVYIGSEDNERSVSLLKSPPNAYYLRISATTSTVTKVDIREADFNMPIGNVSITSNGTVNVSQYETATINVAGGSTEAISVVDTVDSHGGTVRTITSIDISDTTAVASDVASGKYFYTADGTKTAGAASGGSSPVLISKNITLNGTYNASNDSADGYSSVTVNVPSSGGTPSATAHTIYFEFTDSTNTTITAYYDDSFISNAITATTPTTYGQKTITLAELDGVAWYEPANIPLNTQLVDYTALTEDHILDGNTGESVSEQWYAVTDYIVIDPSMTFSFRCGYWYDTCFYDSSKTFISSFNPFEDGITQDSNNSNIGVGTLGENGITIPSNAMYIRMTTVNGANASSCSLIRTA